MLSTIEFDGQHSFFAEEIENVRRKRVLATKLFSVKLTVPQPVPQTLFSVCGIAAKFSGFFDVHLCPSPSRAFARVPPSPGGRGLFSFRLFSGWSFSRCSGSSFFRSFGFCFSSSFSFDSGFTLLFFFRDAGFGLFRRQAFLRVVAFGRCRSEARFAEEYADAVARLCALAEPVFNAFRIQIDAFV